MFVNAGHVLLFSLCVFCSDSQDYANSDHWYACGEGVVAELEALLETVSSLNAQVEDLTAQLQVCEAERRAGCFLPSTPTTPAPAPSAPYGPPGDPPANAEGADAPEPTAPHLPPFTPTTPYGPPGGPPADAEGADAPEPTAPHLPPFTPTTPAPASWTAYGPPSGPPANAEGAGAPEPTAYGPPGGPPADAEGGDAPEPTAPSGSPPTVPANTTVSESSASPPSPTPTPTKEICEFTCFSECRSECEIPLHVDPCEGAVEELEVCRSVPGEPDDCSDNFVCLNEWTCLISGDPCDSFCNRTYDRHPSCGANVSSKCGPCTCGAGSAQEDVVMRGSNGSSWQHEHTYISCTNCTLGQFNGVDGRSACEECLPGYFASSNGSTACAPCSSGSSAPRAGSSACHACLPGTFAAHANNTTSMQLDVMESCEYCAPGHFAASKGQEVCEVCMPGSTADEAGSSACTPCARGSYADSEGTCTSCDVGRFQDIPGKTFCRSCSDVLNTTDRNSNLWTTMARSETGWVHVQGADAQGDCGCREGAWLTPAGDCFWCGEGMVCEGMGTVKLEPGYFATPHNEGFVWRCHGDTARCPGGPPGTCAVHRKNTSIACGECMDGTRETTGGQCEACTSGDVLLLVGVVICVLGALCGIYASNSLDNRAKQKESSALLVITGVQVVTVVQILGVFKILAIEWPSPFDSVVSFASLFKLKILTLNVDCVSPMSALTEYVLIALGVGVLVLTVTGIHVAYVWISHMRRKENMGRFGMYNPTLIGAVGTILMVANVTITDSILTPVQCEGHPNGMQTLKVYRQIVCWNPDFDHQHQIMVGVASVAVLIPLAFLALCVWVVLSLPVRFRQGDVAFLRAFAFLFHRYRPGAYWYAVAVVLRNTLVTLVPIIADEALQLFALVVVLTPCAFLSCSLFPWRVYLANVLDIATNAGFLLTIFLAALSAQDVDRGVVGTCLLVLFTVITALLVAVGILSLFLIFGRRHKSFQFFLCHHKIGGGGFARLLKVMLKDTSAVSRDVFLDADNLEDLALLFGHVGNQTETLIVLCTTEVMSRVWCVGEMTTARLHAVEAILVIFPDFGWPSTESIENCAVYVDGLQSLAEYGISEAMVKETFKWLRGLPRILLPKQITRASMDAVVGRLIVRKSGEQETSSVEGVSSQLISDHEATFVQHQVSSIPDSAAASQVAALVDHSNQEAVCTALLIRELLKAHFPLLDLVPRILTEQDAIKGETTLLVICSNGCFQHGAFVRQLFQAASDEVGMITVVAEQNFRFPTEAFYAEVQQMYQVLPDPCYTPHDLVQIIRQIFEEIAIGVHPQDSEEAVKVRVAAIAHRLKQNSVKFLKFECQRNRLLALLQPSFDVHAGHVERPYGIEEDESSYGEVAPEFTLAFDDLAQIGHDADMIGFDDLARIVHDTDMIGYDEL